MSPQKSKKIEALRAWLVRHGYVQTSRSPDVYQKTTATGQLVRYKIMANNLRKERKVHVKGSGFSPSYNFWAAVRSNPINSLSITEDDKLSLK